MSASPRKDSDAVEPILGLEGDDDGARIVREELTLLKVVQDALARATIADLSAAQGRATDDARLLELRDDVSVAKPEDLPALFEQMHNLGALRAQRGRGQVGTIDRGNPYFGHLRLEEGGRRRDVLIGSKSYLDSNAGVRVVDWRQAPVSRIFYRYGETDDYEELLGGRTVEGVVTVRRSVAISGGQLKRVASPQGTFVRNADGTWKRIEVTHARLRTERKPRLGVGADGEIRQDKLLPAIAAMLDPAQFDLITRPGQGLVVIQGSAGSGKTTVGLHRVAYLAFADPQRYRSDRMLVVVPHEALMHYVGRVLPSLGVEGVPVTTFARWSVRVLPNLFPRLPSHVSDDTPPVVARAKSHSAMLRAIDAAAARVDRALDEKVSKTMASWPEGDRVVIAWADTANDGGASAGSSSSSRGRTQMAPDARVSALALWAAGKRGIAAAGLAATLPDVTKSALDQLGQALRQMARGVLGIWDEILTDRQALADTFAAEVGFGPGQLDQVYEWCVKQTRIRSEGERDGDTPSLDAEDPALLLRIWQVVRGPLLDMDGRPIRFSHVFIDEVQDASPVELRVLLDLAGKDQSVTLAGDTAQRMFADGEDRGEFDWKKLLADLELPTAQIEPLKVSYRSTSEITTFARGVLGPYAHDAEPIATRHGPPVELFTFGSAGETVAFLADAMRELAREEPHANVALVARFAPQAEIYYEGLVTAEVPNLRRVARQDFTWEPGFDVTDVRQTKGREFDEVILLETTATSYGENAAARHALYVGATRAAHQLWCVASEAPSPLVVAALVADP